jgi:hypothetical protein
LLLCTNNCDNKNPYSGLQTSYDLQYPPHPTPPIWVHVSGLSGLGSLASITMVSPVLTSSPWCLGLCLDQCPQNPRNFPHFIKITSHFTEDLDPTPLQQHPSITFFLSLSAKLSILSGYQLNICNIFIHSLAPLPESKLHDGEMGPVNPVWGSTPEECLTYTILKGDLLVRK